jgi:hypothetical protein
LIPRKRRNSAGFWLSFSKSSIKYRLGTQK